MNTDETRFDRLVDDELSENERRELLGGLDDEPGGWRRCALAFLEAQCWKQVFGQTADDRTSRSAGVSPAWENGSAGVSPASESEGGPRGNARDLPTKNPQRSPWAGRLRVLSAMAASFLVALWVGSLAQKAWVARPGLPGAPDQVAHNVENARSLPQPDRPENALATSALPNSAPNPWRLVTVSMPSGGDRPQPVMKLPAIERKSVDEQWLRSMPSAIPDDVLRALARTGHQIQQRRELVPVPLNDGRRLMVPVDQVDVHYVGNNGAY
jgi:hypothetical protein